MRSLNAIPNTQPPASDDAASSSEDPTAHRPASSGGLWWLVVVGLLTVLLCVPFVHFVFALGDEGVLLHGAERMLGGSRLYVDFFEFLPPGGFVVTAAWLAAAGISMWSARCLAILTIAAIACFTYLASRRASKDAPFSAILTVGWVIISQGIWTQISHHWFTTLFSIVTAWAALVSVQHPGRRLQWPLIAGVAAGASAMVTPTRGALAMLAAATAYLKWPWCRTELIVYALGSALVPIALFAYLLAHSALTAAFDDVILFTFNRYASIQTVPFGLWAGLPVKALFPVAALLTLLTFIRAPRVSLGDRTLRTCMAFGVAAFVGCFPRPDSVHIAFATPLVCPLMAYCISRLTQPRHSEYRYAATALVVAGCVSSGHSFLRMSEMALDGEIVPLPRGYVTLVQPGAFFFYPDLPMLPFLTAHQHVSKYDVLLPGYTLPSQYQEACVSAMRRAAWVIVDQATVNPDILKKVFPAMREPQPDEKERFEQALRRGFAFETQAGQFQVRRRTKETDDRLCAGIAG